MGIVYPWKAPDEEVGGDTVVRIDLQEHLPTLIEYLTLSTLNPTILHEDIHPIPVAATPVSSAPLAKKVLISKGNQKHLLSPRLDRLQHPYHLRRMMKFLKKG